MYECEGCQIRQLGDQRCDGCGAFMRRIGVGGACPGCEELIAFDEILQA